MKLLVTGKGGAGSWLVRGEQLGAAMGATVRQQVRDARGFDLAVVVKRTPPAVMEAIRGMRWVWDIVDAYPQPESYDWSRSEAVAWVRTRLRELRPDAVIWPNIRMREDCDTGMIPGMVLPHHHRPGIEVNPIREQVRVVGYEGAEAYLGRLRPSIEAECARRGWQFVVNPRRLADLDIVLAMRGRGGYVSRHWKSNVKLANAHGSGTPFVGARESGYLETASGAEYWADDARGLATAFDWLGPREARQSVHTRFLQRAFPVEEAGAQLARFLHAL